MFKTISKAYVRNTLKWTNLNLNKLCHLNLKEFGNRLYHLHANPEDIYTPQANDIDINGDIQSWPADINSW